jgi:hypothetical protein
VTRSLAYLGVVVLELVLRVCATFAPGTCLVCMAVLDPVHERLAPAWVDPREDMRSVYLQED